MLRLHCQPHVEFLQERLRVHPTTAPTHANEAITSTYPYQRHPGRLATRQRNTSARLQACNRTRDPLNSFSRGPLQARYQFRLVTLVSLVETLFLSHFHFSRSLPLTHLLLLPLDGSPLCRFRMGLSSYHSHRSYLFSVIDVDTTGAVFSQTIST